jgi:hypothetical protein
MVPRPEGFRALIALPYGPFHVLPRIRRRAANSFPAQPIQTHPRFNPLVASTGLPTWIICGPPLEVNAQTIPTSRIAPPKGFRPKVSPRRLHNPRSVVRHGSPRRLHLGIHRPGCRISVPTRRPDLPPGGSRSPDISEELHASLIPALPFVIQPIRRPAKHQPTWPLTATPVMPEGTPAWRSRPPGIVRSASEDLHPMTPASGWIVSPFPHHPEAWRQPLLNPPAEPARRPFPPARPTYPRMCTRRSASKVTWPFDPSPNEGTRRRHR